MNCLALPAPSLARHLARTIDGRSLTGVPGAWSAPIKRKPFKAPKVKRPPLSWCYKITGDGATYRHRIWIVSSQHVMNDGSQCTSLSYVIAKSRRDAQQQHRELSSNLPKAFATTLLCMGVEE
jgi:hypothetical protein